MYALTFHKERKDMMMMMILFTNHFYFKIQVKNLLADTSFKIYVKTPTNNNYERNGDSIFCLPGCYPKI